MKRVLLVLLIIAAGNTLFSQSTRLVGTIKDASTRYSLDNVSISIYSGKGISGTISNSNGNFSAYIPQPFDSIQFSRIGYIGVSLKTIDDRNPKVDIQMLPLIKALDEVTVRPLTADEIIQKTIAATLQSLAKDNFETKNFYREVIRDSSNFYSVAEAVYKTQYFSAAKNFKLQIIKGRTKENVANTRMFEDFHPGGGPQAIAGLSFINQVPDFLNPKKIKWFSYVKEPLQRIGDRVLYVIHFDQQPFAHEALEKGVMYIDADDFTLVKYECVNSPAGVDYIHSLQGTDKLMAKLLNIDFKKKSWKKIVEFYKWNDELFLQHVVYEQNIIYKQPKKNIDLDIVINMEMQVTENAQPIISVIDKDHEWKQKDIPAALPGAFDEVFWGTDNTIQPTKELTDVIASMNTNQYEEAYSAEITQWKKINENMFYAGQHKDSIVMIPLLKGYWHDNETAGMLYQNIGGDFSFETKIVLSKRTDASALSANGFQQAGVMIRNTGSGDENNVLLSIGTAGNPNLKTIILQTAGGKSKVVSQKEDAISGWLKLERKGKIVTAYKKIQQADEWKVVGSFQLTWMKDTLQIGFAVIARFAGNGPKTKPDLRAIFNNFAIKPLQ